MIGSDPITHSRPRDVVHPGWMRMKKLCRSRCEPLWETIVVLLRWEDLPAHQKEHGIQHCNLLRQGRDVGECAQDVCEHFRHWMRVDTLLWIQQGRNTGIWRPHELLSWNALCCLPLPVVEEVQQDTVQGACRRRVSDRSRKCRLIMIRRVA